MNKPLIILVAVSTVLGLSALYQVRQNNTLRQEILDIKVDYEQRIARQQEDYHAEIRDLQKYLFSQYNHRAGAGDGATLPMPDDNTTGSAISRQGAVLFQNRNLEHNLDRKYEDLFPELSLSRVDEEKLRQLLLDRESILNSTVTGYYTDETSLKETVEQQQAMLGDIDGKVAALLTPEDYYRYELLKDSGFEHYQMKRFASGLVEDHALNREQERALLFAKLKHKKIFENTLKAINQNTGGAEAEKSQARNDIAAAIENYQNNFMQEARLFLNDQQYRQLQEYETRQFQEMRQSLYAELAAD